MSKALKVGDREAVKLMEKLTTVRREAGRAFTMEKVEEAFKTGFEESLSMRLVRGKPILWEEGRIKELANKYNSRTWIFSAHQPHQGPYSETHY